MKFRHSILAVIVALVSTIALTAPAAHARAPYCGITWGSLAKASDSSNVASLTNVRAGRHACFDRLVLDYAGDAGGYQVRYVTQIRGLGLDAPVDLRGGALVEIVVQTPYGEDEPSVSATYSPRNPGELVDVAGWRTFGQVSLVEVHESQLTVGLGVRARLPFRVFTLDGPGHGSRLVIDVAHRW
ncbi:MAG: AMIN-like domain-containing (lipo)protein [Jiangellaceae bacterium]